MTVALLLLGAALAAEGTVSADPEASDPAAVAADPEAPSANAEEADEAVERQPPDWNKVYRRATRVARAGSTTITVGELAALGGLIVGIEPLTVAGLAVTQVGVPMMTGGAMRGWWALHEMDYDVLPVAGAFSCGFWGTQLLLTLSSTAQGTRYEPGPYYGAVALQIGAMLTATIQVRQNERAWAVGP